jgi:hypothetical protein
MHLRIVQVSRRWQSISRPHMQRPARATNLPCDRCQEILPHHEALDRHRIENHLFPPRSPGASNSAPDVIKKSFKERHGKDL